MPQSDHHSCLSAFRNWADGNVRTSSRGCGASQPWVIRSSHLSAGLGLAVPPHAGGSRPSGERSLVQGLDSHLRLPPPIPAVLEVTSPSAHKALSSASPRESGQSQLDTGAPVLLLSSSSQVDAGAPALLPVLLPGEMWEPLTSFLSSSPPLEMSAGQMQGGGRVRARPLAKP